MEKTEAELLADIRERRARLDKARADLFAAIRDAFPENRGEPQVRGRLTKVAKASGYTGEYVAQIRDGKVRAE